MSFSWNTSTTIRTLSALLLAPPLLLLLTSGSPFFLFLFLLPVSAILIYEWHVLGEPFSFSRYWPLLASVWCLLLAGISNNSISFALLISLFLLLFFVEGLIKFRPGQKVLDDVGRRFFGMIYCALPLALMLEIRNVEKGGFLLCFLLLVIWGTDVGAYFVGRTFGKRKLAPDISPGKTRAGFVGGVIVACITGVVVSRFFSLDFNYFEVVFLSLLLSMVGQVGDLAESLLKRESGVKDSGNLIPGHGGLLDRLDSLLFAAPILHAFLWWKQIIHGMSGGGLGG